MKICRAAIVALLMFSPMLLHAANPFLGKWVLDPKRSKYSGASCPRRMTIEITETDGGEHYHSETELGNGTAFTADYTANYDDVPAMVKGAHGILLPVSIHREGSKIVIAKYMSGLEARATSRRAVSTDGKTLTVTTISRDGEGIAFTNIGVYQRATAPVAAGFDISKAKMDLQADR